MQIDLIKKEEITKSDINFIATGLKERIESGEINPLLLQQHFKAVEKIAENIKEELRKAAIAETAKYPEKVLLLYGSEFKTQEAGTKYDYSKCGDPVLQELEATLLSAKDAVEKRQNFLKSLVGSETVVDRGTGEIVNVYPPVKTSTTVVTCSIK